MKNAPTNALSFVFRSLLWVALGTTLGAGEIWGMEEGWEKSRKEEVQSSALAASSVFGTMPPEIALDIFSLLEFQDELAMKKTCRHFNGFFSDLILKIDPEGEFKEEEIKKKLANPLTLGIDLSVPEPSQSLSTKCLEFLEKLELRRYPHIIALNLKNNWLEEKDSLLSNGLLDYSKAKFKILLKEEKIFNHIQYLSLANTWINTSTIRACLSSENISSPIVLDFSQDPALAEGLLNKSNKKLSPGLYIDSTLTLNQNIKRMNLTGVKILVPSMGNLERSFDPLSKNARLILEYHQEYYDKQDPQWKKEMEKKFPNIKWVRTLKDTENKSEVLLAGSYPRAADLQLNGGWKVNKHSSDIRYLAVTFKRPVDFTSERPRSPERRENMQL